MRLGSRLKSRRPGQNPAPGAFQDSALSANVTVSNYLSASPTRLVRRAEITHGPGGGSHLSPRHNDPLAENRSIAYLSFFRRASRVRFRRGTESEVDGGGYGLRGEQLPVHQPGADRRRHLQERSASPKKTAAMSDPSRRTRFEGRQSDGDATIRTHQHYRSIID
jgi:hypothetical protein